MAMMAGKKGLVADLNITPMIDVLLVLIIIFMIVVVDVEKRRGVEAQIPQPAPEAASKVEPARTIVIQVRNVPTQAPRLSINRDDVSWSELHDRLARIFLQRAEKVAFVEADRETEFEYVAQVIDIARHAGVDRVGLLTEKMKAGQ